MPKKLLLADDSVVIQKLVGLSFANEDIEIVSTDNGDDAVSMAREVQPDVILADVVMPGLSGYEVCEAIKADPNLSSTPVLLLTGTFEAFDEGRAQSAGANGQITKPFEAQALVERVNEVMAAPVAAPTAPEIEATPASTPEYETMGTSDITEDASAAPAPAVGLDISSSELFDSNVSQLAADESVSILPETSEPTLPGRAHGDTTASGLFGAPGEGAAHDLDTQGGSMALGQTVGTTDLSEEEATLIASVDEMPPLESVNLGAAIDDIGLEDDATILVARDDINATTIPALDEIDDLSGNLEETPPAEPITSVDPVAPDFDDLTVHVPSADIDQDRAAAQSPDLVDASGPISDAAGSDVTDLDAKLTGQAPVVAEAATPPPIPDLPRTPRMPTPPPLSQSQPQPQPEETVVQIQDETDPLGFAPRSAPSISDESTDFAFDVSEQVQLPDERDAAEDSFSSLMDISESQILGGPQEAPLTSIDEPSSAATIVAGYDVSSSDLATADTPSEPALPPQAAVPGLDEPTPIRDLPQAYQPTERSGEQPTAEEPIVGVPEAEETVLGIGRAADDPITGRPDLFDDLATGSAIDEFDTFGAEPASTHAPEPISIGDDLLNPELEDLSTDLMTSATALPDEPLIEISEPAVAEVEPTPIEVDAPALSLSDSGSGSDLDTPPVEPAQPFPAPANESERRVADLSPVMEQRIQETLEKVAWEAFSDLSESIVKQVMGRVEQIAWEVIPEMAETLVREEIRKMKGEED